jgi:hypothetical protein
MLWELLEGRSSLWMELWEDSHLLPPSRGGGRRVMFRMFSYIFLPLDFLPLAYCPQPVPLVQRYIGPLVRPPAYCPQSQGRITRQSLRARLRPTRPVSGILWINWPEPGMM